MAAFIGVSAMFMLQACSPKCQRPAQPRSRSMPVRIIGRRRCSSPWREMTRHWLRLGRAETLQHCRQTRVQVRHVFPFFYKVLHIRADSDPNDMETVLPHNVEGAWWGVGLLLMVKASAGFWITKIKDPKFEAVKRACPAGSSRSFH